MIGITRGPTRPLKLDATRKRSTFQVRLFSLKMPYAKQLSSLFPLALHAGFIGGLAPEHLNLSMLPCIGFARE